MEPLRPNLCRKQVGAVMGRPAIMWRGGRVRRLVVCQGGPRGGLIIAQQGVRDAGAADLHA
eukprot:scaffold321266_cov41-Prasinocladus_malaysianus.AAC.1